MLKYQPGRNAFVAGGLGVVISAIAAMEGIRLYTTHNTERCGGGLGWLAPVLGLYATLAVALLATLVALVLALVAALARRRWTWVVGLVTVTAVGVLIAAGSDSQISRALVGSTLGFGCSWFYPEVAQSLVPLLVATPALVCLMAGRRQEQRRA